MTGKFEAGVEKNGQLTLKMKKFIVAHGEKARTGKKKKLQLTRYHIEQDTGVSSEPGWTFYAEIPSCICPEISISWRGGERVEPQTKL